MNVIDAITAAATDQEFTAGKRAAIVAGIMSATTKQTIGILPCRRTLLQHPEFGAVIVSDAGEISDVVPREVHQEAA